jgi:antitoxin CptB
MVVLLNMTCVLWSASEVQWRSRRGLLELDLILMPYCRDCYASLSEHEKNDYQWLLQQTDMDLQKWLLWRKDIERLSVAHRAVLERIWEYAQNKALVMRDKTQR